MPNQHLLQRLTGIQTILNGVYQAGQPMSAATKGTERAAFIDSFLSQALPPIYRFGTGDATDVAGNRSGQLDVVIEYPFAPTVPMVAGTSTSRLYLAEGIAAVVEVKSDVAAQWDDAQRTAAHLSPLRRRFAAGLTMGRMATPEIPLFIVGYTGWKQHETIQRHLQSATNIAGVLVIEDGLFVSGPQFGGLTAAGPLALWGLVHALYEAASSMQSAVTIPALYAM